MPLTNVHQSCENTDAETSLVASLVLIGQEIMIHGEVANDELLTCPCRQVPVSQVINYYCTQLELGIGHEPVIYRGVIYSHFNKTKLHIYNYDNVLGCDVE